MFNVLKKISQKDQLIIIILTVFYLVMITLTYAKWGQATVDCFRDPYVANEILRGKLLYKDIYFLYGPLVPYFIALLFIIFGIHLNVIYILGILTTFIIIMLVYYLSRQLLSPVTSAILIFLFMIQCVFQVGIVQYIYPYSFEALFGTLFILLLLLCLTKFIKSNFLNDEYLFYSGLIIAILPLFKQDAAISGYLIFYLFLVYCLWRKKISFKIILEPLLISTLVPVIIYIILSTIFPAHSMMESLIPVHKCDLFLYKKPFEEFLSIKNLKHISETFFLLTLFSSICISLLYILMSIKRKYFPVNNIIWEAILVIIGIYLIAYYNDIINFDLIEKFLNTRMYEWLYIFLLIFMLYMLYKNFKSKNIPNQFQNILLLYTASAIVLLYRYPYPLDLRSISNYYTYTAFIVLFYFIYSFVPKLIKLKTKYYKYALSIFLFYIGLLLTCEMMFKYQHINLPIQSERGIKYDNIIRSNQLQEAIKLVKKYTTPRDKIVTVPEDVIINFMADRQGASKYFQQQPYLTDSKELQAEIIQELKKNKPRLILISTNTTSLAFGKVRWGEDFFINVFEWIKQNYSFAGTLREYVPELDGYSPYKINVYSINSSDKK